MQAGENSIRYEKECVGVIAYPVILVGEVVSYCYKALVYHDLSIRKEVCKTYGDGGIGVTKGNFPTYAVR